MNKSKVIYCVIAAVFLSVMFSSLAYAQDGTSEIPSLLDMILLGLIIFLLVRMFRRRSNGERRNGNNIQDHSEDDSPAEQKILNRYDSARAAWNMLAGDDAQPVASGIVKSSEFDEAEFLEGAKLFYHRFMEASASGDWRQVSEFIAPHLLDELKKENFEKPSFARVDIMLLEARVAEVSQEQGVTRVSVFFDAQLRTGASGEKNKSERAVWELVRQDENPNALWTLDAINKVDQ